MICLYPKDILIMSNNRSKDTQQKQGDHQHFDLYHQNHGDLQSSPQQKHAANHSYNDEVRSIGKSEDLKQSGNRDIRRNDVSANDNQIIQRNSMRSQGNQSRGEIQPNPITEEIQRSPSRQPQNQRTASEKCPSWLKTLILMISLVALGGFAYWLFFKRGKTPHIKHPNPSDKKEEAPHTTTPLPLEKKEEVKVEKVETVSNTVVVPKIEENKEVAKVEERKETVQVKPVQVKPIEIPKEQVVASVANVEKIETKEEKVETKEAKKEDSKVQVAKVEEVVKVKPEEGKPVSPEAVVVQPIENKPVETTVETKVSEVKEVKEVKPESTKIETKEQTTVITPVQPVEESKLPKEEVKTPETVVLKADEKPAQTPVAPPTPIPVVVAPQPVDEKKQPPKAIENPEDANTIIVPRGNKTFCPDDQFLLNGNCMKCPPKMVWSGLDCVLRTPKHLSRSH